VGFDGINGQAKAFEAMVRMAKVSVVDLVRPFLDRVGPGQGLVVRRPAGASARSWCGEVPRRCCERGPCAPGYVIHAAKVHDQQRPVACCVDVYGWVEPFGLFKLRRIEEDTV